MVAAGVLVLTNRPAPAADPLGVAVAQVSAGSAGVSLEQERQNVIMEDAATQSFSMTSAPKISTVQKVAPPAKKALPPPPPPPPPAPDPAGAKVIAQNLMGSYGFASSQWSCLDDLWTRESSWLYNAENASGAYGIPQALPADKMATVAADWRTDPTTQIKWGLGYIKSRYGSPCAAWDMEEDQGFY